MASPFMMIFTILILPIHERGKIGKDARIIAVLEPRSNTMKMGVHKDDIAPSLHDAQAVFIYQPDTIPWKVSQITDALTQPAK